MAPNKWNELVEPFWKWKFEASCFMILMGEQEEVKLRLMRRSIFECLSAAPVSGLGSYIRSSFELTDVTGLSYISPYGGTKAPLRNMRTARLISDQKLLRDGHAKVYKLKTKQEMMWHERYYFCAICWILITWAAVAAIIVWICKKEGTTWIGLVACILFPVWSIVVRILEMGNTLITENKQRSSPENPDAIVILGRRESCLVLEGSRKTISKWTGQGVEQKSAFVEWFIRLGSLIILLSVFILVPNGTTYDQIAWIILNLLGLVNIMVSQRLNSERSLRRLTEPSNEKTENRTQVWGFLLRRFNMPEAKNKWVDHLDIPKTDVWRKWQDMVLEDKYADPKQIYSQVENESKTK